jgi:hypothetical protein
MAATLAVLLAACASMPAPNVQRAARTAHPPQAGVGVGFKRLLGDAVGGGAGDTGLRRARMGCSPLHVRCRHAGTRGQQYSERGSNRNGETGAWIHRGTLRVLDRCCGRLLLGLLP